MRIGELAEQARMNPQTLRYYERRGLLGPRRSGSGYRDYGPEALRQLRFIRGAQDLGFTLDEISDLLGLWADSARSCSAAEQRASATLERIEGKISDLRRMGEALSKYVSACRSRSSLQECPLLEAIGRDGDSTT